MWIRAREPRQRGGATKTGGQWDEEAAIRPIVEVVGAPQPWSPQPMGSPTQMGRLGVDAAHEVADGFAAPPQPMGSRAPLGSSEPEESPWGRRP